MFRIIFSIVCIFHRVYHIQSFRQHETVIHENLTITFKEIYNWDKIFELLNVAIEHNENRPDHEIQISLSGIFIRPIWCPKKLNCSVAPDYNFTKDYDFQPPSIVKHGGVCGLDFTPGPPSREGEIVRLFLLPQLSRLGKDAIEGPRGVIATSNGLVFDLAGGCQGCITVYPEIGDNFIIRNHHSVRHLSHVHPVVIAALHSHSETYFHAVSELLPRLYLIMDYIDSNFQNLKQSPKDMLFSTKPHYALLNSMNEMMEWGLKPTERFGPHNHWHGTFMQPRNRGAIEASQHIISGPYIQRNWYTLIKAARRCAAKQLVEYTRVKAKPVCALGNTLEKYILFIPREGERQRSLLNYTHMVNFMKTYFDVPVIIPNLKYGCHLQDNIIYFKTAIGFISPHGAAFTNIIFIGNKATVIQFVPPKPHPFTGPAQSYANQIKELGHKYMEVQTKSNSDPRWDLFFDLKQFVEKICQPNNPSQKVNSMFDSWLPKNILIKLCSSSEGISEIILSITK